MLLNRLFKVEGGEWPKLLQFGLLGLLLQTGLGVGFSAGDAAFLAHVGSGKLPIIFLLTPVVMAVYTGVFSILQVRFSIDRVVDLTLGMLALGGVIGWGLLSLHLPQPFQTYAYYALKLYMAMWYIALYTLFWNFTDAYFDIQDAKRLFPLFAAFCALGSALGALIVGLLARSATVADFLLIWSGVALLTFPVARLIRRRWRRIADSDTDLEADEEKTPGQQLARVAAALRQSRYVVTLVLTLFVTLLLTNLAEYQYATVLQAGRSEASLAGLFGRLYAATSAFNLVVCLFVFTPLVTRIGVRNVALIQPLTYFAAFAYFFVSGGIGAALAAFFAYHGVLTSIEYNNQNLLFNAAPSTVKRPLRTLVEGMGEPLASFLAGGFLLLAGKQMDIRELSGIGLLLAALLLAVVMALRVFYPAAMAANMRHGWLNFGDRSLDASAFDPEAKALLTARSSDADSGTAAAARSLLHRRAARRTGPGAIAYEPSEATEAFAARLDDPSPSARRFALQSLQSVVGPGDIALVPILVEKLPRLDRSGRATILDLLAAIGDVEAIPQILAAAARLSPRELRATEAMLVDLGEAAIPRLMQALANFQAAYRARSVAARALAALSAAQFQSQLGRLVAEELDETGPRLAVAERFDAEQGGSEALGLLARAYRERIAASVDFVLELLALGGRLPDFDLLIVSLHSANPKVRANAVEAIEAGVDHATYRRLKPLIHQRAAAARAGAATGELVTLLDSVVASGFAFEAAAAAQALRDQLPPEALARRLRAGVKPEMAPLLRETISRLLAVGGAGQPTVVDLVAALQRRPEFAAASIEALVALAERVREGPGDHSVVELSLATGARYLDQGDVDGVAARYPDLSLAMLRAGDGRAYAA